MSTAEPPMTELFNTTLVDPGSVFKDDLTPPSSPTTTTSSDQPIDPSLHDPSTGGGGGGPHGQTIEVGSTIQIVLVALGIVIGLLFLFGVVATYYVSHKNKKAESRKHDHHKGESPPQEKQLPSPPPSILPRQPMSNNWLTLDESTAELTIDDALIDALGIVDPFAGADTCTSKGNGKEGTFPTQEVVGSNNAMASSSTLSLSMPNTSSTSLGLFSDPPADCDNTSNSNNSTRSRMPALLPSITPTPRIAGRGTCQRNSYIDVAQVYARRQSLFDPAVDFTSLAQHALPIRPQAQSTIPETGYPSINPKRHTLLLDPFELAPTESEISAAVEMAVNSSSTAPVSTTTHHAKGSSITTSGLSEPHDAFQAEDYYAEPKVILRKPRYPSPVTFIQSIPAQPVPYRHSMIQMATPTYGSRYGTGGSNFETGTAGPRLPYRNGGIQGISAVTPEISYQPPSQPTSPILEYIPSESPSFQDPNQTDAPGLPSTLRAHPQQRMRVDRRVMAESDTSEPEDGPSTATNSSAWYWKRASVIIPEGVAPVRLWREDPQAAFAGDDQSSLRSAAASPLRSLSPVRDGAAVFEGIRSRTTSPTPTSQPILEVSEGLHSQPPTVNRRKWAAGRIAFQEVGSTPITNHETTGYSGSADLEDQGLYRVGRSSLENNITEPISQLTTDPEHERVIVSMPNPRGCLLEAAEQQQQQQQQQQQTEENDVTPWESYEPPNQDDPMHSSSMSGYDALPAVVLRSRKKDGPISRFSTLIRGEFGGLGSSGGSSGSGSGSNSGGKKSYLDDYREQVRNRHSIAFIDHGHQQDSSRSRPDPGII